MPATTNKLLSCAQCHRYLPRLLANEQRHFCDENCAHEWSSTVLGAERPAHTYELLNRLRQYLAAYIAGEGIEPAFLRMCIAAESVFKELNLKALMSHRDLSLAIYGAAEDPPEEPEIQFP